jgi:hypothetical protein
VAAVAAIILLTLTLSVEAPASRDVADPWQQFGNPMDFTFQLAAAPEEDRPTIASPLKAGIAPVETGPIAEGRHEATLRLKLKALTVAPREPVLVRAIILRGRQTPQLLSKDFPAEAPLAISSRPLKPGESEEFFLPVQLPPGGPPYKAAVAVEAASGETPAEYEFEVVSAELLP